MVATLVPFHDLMNGGSSVGETHGNTVTPLTDCTLESIRVRVFGSAAATMKVCIWDATSHALLGSGAVTQSFADSGSYDVPLSSPVPLAAGTSYVLSAWSPTLANWITSSNNFTWPHDHSASGYAFTLTGAGYFTGDGFPSGDSREHAIFPWVSPAVGFTGWGIPL